MFLDPKIFNKNLCDKKDKTKTSLAQKPCPTKDKRQFLTIQTKTEDKTTHKTHKIIPSLVIPSLIGIAVKHKRNLINYLLYQNLRQRYFLRETCCGTCALDRIAQPIA